MTIVEKFALKPASVERPLDNSRKVRDKMFLTLLFNDRLYVIRNTGSSVTYFTRIFFYQVL